MTELNRRNLHLTNRNLLLLLLQVLLILFDLLPSDLLFTISFRKCLFSFSKDIVAECVDSAMQILKSILLVINEMQFDFWLSSYENSDEMDVY